MQNLTHDHINALLPPRPDNSHKMTFGHVLNIAGSIHYRGAGWRGLRHLSQQPIGM